MTPEHLAALLQLIAELRIQIGQMGAENDLLRAELAQRDSVRTAAAVTTSAAAA